MFLSFNIRTVIPVLSFGVVFSGIACNKDETTELFVDSTLMQYFNRFVTEGASRNVIVDYESARVSGYIRTIQTPNVIGQCVHDSNQPNKVIIDRDYWSTSTDLEREFLVFHELGHCVLNREHLDNADENGNCSSIMTSGSFECRLNYTLSTRKKLLDELFMK